MGAWGTQNAFAVDGDDDDGDDNECRKQFHQNPGDISGVRCRWASRVRSGIIVSIRCRLSR